MRILVFSGQVAKPALPPSFMRGVDAEWAKPIPGGRGESIWAWMIEKHPQKPQLRTPPAPDRGTPLINAGGKRPAEN